MESNDKADLLKRHIPFVKFMLRKVQGHENLQLQWEELLTTIKSQNLNKEQIKQIDEMCQSHRDKLIKAKNKETVTHPPEDLPNKIQDEPAKEVAEEEAKPPLKLKIISRPKITLKIKLNGIIKKKKDIKNGIYKVVRHEPNLNHALKIVRMNPPPPSPSLPSPSLPSPSLPECYVRLEQLDMTKIRIHNSQPLLLEEEEEEDKDDDDSLIEPLWKGAEFDSRAPMVSIPTDLIRGIKEEDATLLTIAQTNTKLRPWLHDANEHRKFQDVCDQMLGDLKCLAALFKCMSSECSFYTVDAITFKAHLQIHFDNTGLKHYLLCCYCSYEAFSTENLVQHVIDEHGSERFQCPHCFYRTFDFFMESHYEQYHNEQQRVAIKCASNYAKTICFQTEETKVRANVTIPAMSCMSKCFFFVSQLDN